MPKKNGKQLESMESVSGKVEKLSYGGKDNYVEEKMSFEPGVEERRSNGDSGDEENDELTFLRSDKSDKSS